MNDEERISFLLRRYISNQCSESELQELFKWIGSNKDETVISEELKALWQDSQPEHCHTGEQWEHLYKNMMETHQNRGMVKQLKWIKFTVAAAIIITLSLSFYFYKEKIKVAENKLVKTNAELKPGTNTAILTLGNGSRVILDDVKGSVAVHQGIQIIKTANGQLVYKLHKTNLARNAEFNTIETPKGGQYQIVMSDGSSVWLNAHSSLKYPISFGAKDRVVELIGEAYFEIAKNKEAPFKVLTGNQIVEVLGTHFNINGYADEPDIKTTLLEGSVKVSSVKNDESTMLMPGQQSIFRVNDLHVNQVDAEETIAWKNGYFTFNNSNLESIMRQVSRWYNVDIVYQNSKVKHQLFSGNVSRFENASQVLSILELTGLVHFKVEGRRIIAML